MCMIFQEPDKFRVPRALVPYVPCALRAFVPRVPCTVEAFVPHLPYVF